MFDRYNQSGTSSYGEDPFKVNFHQPIYSLADCSVKPSRPSPFRVAFASLDGTSQSAF